MKVYSIDVHVAATAYVKARTAQEAWEKVRALQDCSPTILDHDGDVEVSGRMFSDPDLPEVSLSPAMTIKEPYGKGADDMEEQHADAPAFTLDEAQEIFRTAPTLVNALVYIDVARGYFEDEMVQWKTLRAAYDEAVPKVIGQRVRFAYPEHFVTLPDYSAHRGQIVTVTSEDDDCDDECAPMFKIKADDGWTGTAWADELEAVKMEDAA